LGVRHRLVGLAVGVALLGILTGCTSAAAGAPRAATSPPGSVRQPAEYAGGACQLMNFDLVKASLGVGFDIAGAGNVDDSFTCVLQKVDSPLPDLALAVTPTEADTGLFHDKVAPGRRPRSGGCPATGG
jgi:hypothetical protein